MLGSICFALFERGSGDSCLSIPVFGVSLLVGVSLLGVSLVTFRVSVLGLGLFYVRVSVIMLGLLC